MNALPIPSRHLIGLALGGLLFLLASCVENGSTEEGSVTNIQGGWELSDGAECQLRLAFRGDATFSQQSRLVIAGLEGMSLAEGVFNVEAPTAGNTGINARISPGQTAPPRTLLYCSQWNNAEKSVLPFDRILLDSGLDVPSLSFRQIPVPGKGWFWVGSDAAALTERFVLYLDGNGLLRGFPLDMAIAPLYHRDPRELFGTMGSDTIVNLPQETYRQTFTGLQSGDVGSAFLLKVNTAADVTFSSLPGSPLPVCQFVSYQSPDYVTIMNPDPLAGAGGGAPVPLNPLHPGQTFYVPPPLAGNEADAEYFLPIAIVMPAPGECSANIRARPIAIRLSEDRLALPPLGDPIALSLGKGPSFILAIHPSRPGVLIAIALDDPATIWEGLSLLPNVFDFPDLSPGSAWADSDILALFSDNDARVQMTVQSGGDRTFLNIFAEGNNAFGLGPFFLRQSLQPVAVLPFPSTVTESFQTGEFIRRYRFSLSTPTRVGITTQSGLDTTGRLLDSTGITLAWDRDGSTDGAGFRILRSLPAGNYDLEVLLQQPPGDVQLILAPAALPALEDEALTGCMIAAGGGPDGGSGIPRVICAKRGIQSLAGIKAYPDLALLALEDNLITDLAPLRNLLKLHSLSLAGNPLTDFTPLTAISSLRWLSLARTALTPGDLTVLSGMDPPLTVLVLREATGISDADAAALKANLPDTILVTPSGTVLQ